MVDSTPQQRPLAPRQKLTLREQEVYEGRRVLVDEDTYPREPAELVEGPAVRRNGDNVEIVFALDKPDDVLVRIVDADLDFTLNLIDDRLLVGRPADTADLTIEGTVYTFLQLATRNEDSDTLFFRRQLKMSGDTELGLYVKNFLEGIEPESLPLQPALGHVLDFSLRAANAYGRLSSWGSRQT